MEGKRNSGVAVHCHHNILIEYCYDFAERIKNIKRNKPEHEQAIRLQLFRLLPEESLSDLPIDWQKAYVAWQKAYVAWQKAYVDRQKAEADQRKADADWRKAYVDWWKAEEDWPQPAKDAFHKKWCGCVYWENGKIDFTKKDEEVLDKGNVIGGV